MKSRSRLHLLVRLVIGSAILIVTLSLITFGGQKRRRAPVPRSQATVRSTQVDYSQFSHSTKQHQAECNTCHRVPTDNWKKVRDFPDVADYPGHAACLSCHRPQFFKGAKPVICSVCHSKVSPRDDARFAFRNPVSAREFSILYPHDKHQDVIATLLSPVPRKTPSLFVHASFSNSSTADDKTKIYNNCEICHRPRTAPAIAPASGWVDSFIPDAGAFKAVPASHAACFNCHWKSQQPSSGNCAGCHQLAYKSSFPIDSPIRFSMKFRHAREQHVAECTTCHINITKASTLRGLKPDVPITSCTECHNKDGLRLDVSKELEALDQNREFVCSYCHTSDVGRRDAPASHYLIAGRAALKRKDIK